MSLPFEVPGRFDGPLYERVGAILRDKATGRIVGHVQEVGLGRVVEKLIGASPLDLVTDGIQILQMAKIQRTLETVQTLSTISAAASVATLGISVAGFALVLARLGRMDQKLDKVMAASGELRRLSARVNVKIDAIQLSRLRAELEAVSMARHYSAQRRREALSRSVAELANLRHYYAELLADPSLVQVGTADATALLDAHERMTAAAEGELFAEYLLDNEPELVAQRWHRQLENFNRVAWGSPKHLYDLLEEADKANGAYLLTAPSDRAAVTRSLLATRKESLDRLASFPLLAAEIHSHGVGPTAYLEALERSAKDFDEPVLILAARS
ncbi:MAG TPA: hypothetical protein PK306_11985 [Aquabacterium sp.]|nr:hypothetical protein [Aquabacterium sp.]